MGLRQYAGTALTVLLLGLLLVIVLGQALGQPIGLGFVITGSMSPTLEPGDGFVAVPPALAGDIEQGDVVTFTAEEIQGGGLTTHRVVGETSEGFVTRGDANPFTDQDGGEPPVRETDIKAVALQVNGEVVVIPNFGTAIMALQGAFGTLAGFMSFIPGLAAVTEGGIASVMTGLGLLVLGLSFVGELLGGKSRGDRERSDSREGVISAWLILAVIILVITVPATVSMVIPSGVNELQVISSSSPTEDPTIVERGGSTEFTYNGTNSGLLPIVAVVEPASNGVTVTNGTLVMFRGEKATATVTITVPDETGVYVRAISVRQYTQVMPTPFIVAMHNIHPWVAILGINLYLVAIVTILYGIVVGFNPVRMRSTGRNLSMIDRIKRKLP
jgi:signal peptidase